MHRVVVTGIGIVSCIGNEKSEVVKNLKNLNSGISSAKEYEDYSFRSLVHGKPNIDINKEIDRRLLRFMGDGLPFGSLWAWVLHTAGGLEGGSVASRGASGPGWA